MSPEWQARFEAQFVRGETHFQKYLAKCWDRFYSKRIPTKSQRREWQKIVRATNALLRSMPKAAPGGVFRDDTDPDAGMIVERGQLEALLARARFESEPRVRGLAPNRERVFWVAALLPYLIYETGKPRWGWLAKFIEHREGLKHTDAIGVWLTFWWTDIMKTMMKRFPAKTTQLPDCIPALPPSNPPFDASAELILYHLASPDHPRWQGFRKIVFECIPFFSRLPADWQITKTGYLAGARAKIVGRGDTFLLT